MLGLLSCNHVVCGLLLWFPMEYVWTPPTLWGNGGGGGRGESFRCDTMGVALSPGFPAFFGSRKTWEMAAEQAGKPGEEANIGV